ncbi:MAG: twin-arginine translocase TatA/TatE family subunit [Rhizomicrobium sp.]|jgi:sec-independent protein translocase protein TatA
MFGLSFTHILILVLVLVVIFGRGRLVAMMSDLGRGVKAFRKNLAESDKDPPHGQDK